MDDSLEDALGKIRPHVSSKLAHQQAPAALLRALDGALAAQTTERTPTAYFAALLTTLDGALAAGSVPDLDDGAVVPAALYLLALVAPSVPPPVLRAHAGTLLGLLAPLLPPLDAHAPALRSALGVLAALLCALDRAQLEAPPTRQAFGACLARARDARPKVRRRAAELVRAVLAAPPAPLARHPYAPRVAEWTAAALVQAAADPLARGKGKKSAGESDAADGALHVLALLRLVLLKLPPSTYPELTTALLALPRLGNPYLAQSAYSLLADLLAAPADEDAAPGAAFHAGVAAQVPALLKAVLSSPPPRTDNALAPAWLALLAAAVALLRRADAPACAEQLPRAWRAAWALLESGDGVVRGAAAASLGRIARAMPPALVRAGMVDAAALRDGTEPSTALGRIIAQASAALDALPFAHAVGEVLVVIAALVSALRARPAPDAPSAAEALLLPLVEKVAGLRTARGFEHKEAADSVLRAAMRALGPAVVLGALPLHLEPADRAAGREPRAFLLPLLAQPHPAPLAHFVGYFVPLSERMFDLQAAADAAGRAAEAKLWAVLIGQIWAGLPGYCAAAPDIAEAMTPEFAQLLSQLLYGQPELRPHILRALRVLVDANVAAAAADAREPDFDDADDAPVLPQDAAARNVVFLRAQAASWLAVLFNVFGAAERDARGAVGDVVGAWAGVANPQDLAQAYANVVALFQQNLASGQASVAAATQDLLLLLLPHLARTDAAAFLQLVLTSGALTHADGGVQKRAYKALSRVLELADPPVPADAPALLAALDSAGPALAAPAARERLRALALLVRRVPADALALLPPLVPEAVLGTKEPAEKARAEAFALVLAMADKFRAGGTVRRPAPEDGGDGDGGTMAEDGAPPAEGEDVPADLPEFVTVLAGGLAGATPHMISATVTALARVVFEYKDEIPDAMHAELLTTLLVFLGSANREIVKATLGYTKLVAHTLPAALLRPHLPALVAALLRWAGDGRNHFKAKVRHVCERLLRRFGFDVLYAAAESEDGRKVLANIKKRKERAKRKRAAAADGAEDEDAPVRAAPATGDAFEDVLYGSESELGDSDDDDDGAAERRPAPRGKAAGARGARLRVDDDEPMDLLHGAGSKLTAGADRRRRPGQDAARFRTDADTGKLVLGGSDDSDADADAGGAPAGDDVAGGAYREKLTSADGFARGAGGRVKFHRDTKKRRRDAADAEDVEMDDAAPAPAPAAGAGAAPAAKKARARTEQRFGHEFKAKKAGGDVKKGAVDPYAYMPLAQAAQKRHGKQRTGLSGKR